MAEKLYVVVCKYDGCDDCGSIDGHVVAASFDKAGAERVARAHDADKKAHYGHYHFTDVVTLVGDKLFYAPEI